MADRKDKLTRGGLLTGAVAFGVAAGLAAERFLVGRERRRPDPQAREPFGRVRGRPTGPVASFDGTLLNVEEIGSGPPVVFLHGFSLSVASWHYQMLEFANDYRCVLYDHRGHGKSGKPVSGDWSLEALARDLDEVLHDAVRDEPAVVVGHSMGGMTALKFCDMFPEALGPRVSGLVLVDTTAADVMGGMLPGVARRAEAAIQALQEALLPALAGNARRIDRIRTRASDLSYLVVRVMGLGPKPSPAVVAFVARMLSETPTEVWLNLIPTLTGMDVSHVLDKISVPTMVVVGAHDRLTPPGGAERIARGIRDAELVPIRGAGHMPMLERPDSFNAALRAFLARVAARPRLARG